MMGVEFLPQMTKVARDPEVKAQHRNFSYAGDICYIINIACDGLGYATAKVFLIPNL